MTSREQLPQKGTRLETIDRSGDAEQNRFIIFSVIIFLKTFKVGSAENSHFVFAENSMLRRKIYSNKVQRAPLIRP